VKNAHSAITKVADAVGLWVTPLEKEMASIRTSYEQHKSFKEAMQQRTQAAEDRQVAVCHSSSLFLREVRECRKMSSSATFHPRKYMAAPDGQNLPCMRISYEQHKSFEEAVQQMTQRKDKLRCATPRWSSSRRVMIKMV
jgi:hypothetical protein